MSLSSATKKQKCSSSSSPAEGSAFSMDLENAINGTFDDKNNFVACGSDRTFLEFIDDVTKIPAEGQPTILQYQLYCDSCNGFFPWLHAASNPIRVACGKEAAIRPCELMPITNNIRALLGSMLMVIGRIRKELSDPKFDLKFKNKILEGIKLAVDGRRCMCRLYVAMYCKAMTCITTDNRDLKSRIAESYSVDWFHEWELFLFKLTGMILPYIMKYREEGIPPASFMEFDIHKFGQMIGKGCAWYKRLESDITRDFFTMDYHYTEDENIFTPENWDAMRNMAEKANQSLALLHSSPFKEAHLKEHYRWEILDDLRSSSSFSQQKVADSFLNDSSSSSSNTISSSSTDMEL